MKLVEKNFLDELVERFETPDFIEDDPVQFPHRYSKQQDIEVSAFISSAFAYGSRIKIIETLECIHNRFEGSPYEFVINFDLDRDLNIFSGFCYRYNKERDINYLISALGETLKEYKSLEQAFMSGYVKEEPYLRKSITNFVNLLRSNIPCKEGECMRTVNHLIPSPAQGSACKRLSLFLKWMVRKGPVDLNIWRNVPESKLIIPLDTHVSRISRMWGLTQRKSDDWKTAEEITENLKKFDSNDPSKYDFAIFGAGVSGLI